MVKPIFVSTCILLCAGCATVRSARDAQRASGASLPPGERAFSETLFPSKDDNVVTLPEAQRVSLGWHPEMVVATQNVVSAEIAVHQAGVNLRPVLSSSGSYGGSTQASDVNDWDRVTSDSFDASLSLSWVLYDFGRTRAKQRAAVEQLIGASASLRATVLQRTLSVCNAYFSLAEAKAQQAVDMENLRLYSELLRQAELKFKIGKGRNYDITKTRADRSEALLSLLVTSNTIRNAQATLSQELCLKTPVTFEIQPTYKLPQPADVENIDALLGIAKTNNPNLRLLQAKVAAASAAVDQAIADLYPQLRASASTSYGTDPQTWGLSWGASIVQDLFTGWKRRDAIRQSEVGLRQARANLVDQELQITSKLIQAHTAYLTAMQSKLVAEEMQVQTLENYTLEKKQFDLGMSSILELNDAQVLYIKACSSNVKAEYAIEKAKAGIYAIVGIEPQF